MGSPATAIWRPPQWSGSSFGVPALTMTAQNPTTGQQTAYVFDGIIRAEHEQRLVITMNPVQTGAAISDNAYVVPASVVVEISMSDAMQSFTTGQWAGGPSRSVNAYQTLCSIQESLTTVQLSTRLRPYTNMMIESVRALESPETRYALKALVTFRKIITATVTTISSTSSSLTSSLNSQIPQSTTTTTSGQIQTQPVPGSITAQNSISNSPINLAQVPAVAGAGTFSSYNVNGLSSVVPVSIPGLASLPLLPSNAQLVPLSPLPNQSPLVTVQVNGGPVSLSINQYYNRIGGFWAMDIATPAGKPLVSSVPLLTGSWPAANVMAPFEYLGIGSWYIINQNGATTDWPNSSNLGTGFVAIVGDNT